MDLATAGIDFVNHQLDPDHIKHHTVQLGFKNRWLALDPPADGIGASSIEEAIARARSLADKYVREEAGETAQVLITGSLHLVGGALAILEGPDAL